MTGQMSDTLRYKKEDYNVTGVKGSGLFHPEDVELTPFSSCTACWRGFVASYKIGEEDELQLAGLLINTEDKGDINGIKANKLSDSLFTYQFADLNIKIPFTGNLLIGTEFIQSMYVHMGFQKPITYTKVIELKFKNGDLLRSQDISLKIKKIRERGNESLSRPSSEEDIGKWIERSFSLDYD